MPTTAALAPRIIACALSQRRNRFQWGSTATSSSNPGRKIITSATAFGWALGPTAGAYMGSAWGFRAVFFVTAAFFSIVACWAWRAMADIDLQEPPRRAWLAAVRRRLAQRREREV